MTKIIRTGLKEHADREVCRILNKISSGKALDVGCGTGEISLYLAKRGFKVTAIDHDPQAISIVKKKLRGYLSTVSVDSFSGFSSTFKFDLIILREVLEHIKDDRLALKKIHLLLKKDGAVLITVPGQKYLYGPHDKMSGHFRRYQKNELLNKVRQANLKIDFFQSLGFPFFNLTTLIYNHLPHKNKFRHTGLNKPYKNLIFLSKKILPLRFFGFVSEVFKNKSWGAQFVLLAKKV